MQPAASFQAVEHRVKRRHVETYRAAGALLDEFADLVTVARASFDKRKNKEFRAASFPIRFVNLRSPYMGSQHIKQRRCLRVK